MQQKYSNMRGKRAAVIFLLSVSSLFGLLWGSALARAARGVILDFKIVYYGARSLVQNRDPYSERELMQVYLAEGGEKVPEDAKGHRTQLIVASQMYLPSAALFTAPFGMLPWPIAYLAWIALTVCGLTGSAILMWIVASRYASGPALYLISFLLMNSGVLFAGGNPAGIAVSLCIVAVWCFLEDRFLYFGVLCLAGSLAIKPHDSGLVWLYFLLAGGVYRKLALKSLLVTAALALIAVAWIWHLSPHWLQELESNVQAYSAPGSNNDPGPVANKTIGTGMIIDLQTITSVLLDDPRFYKPTAYLLCAPFFVVWIFHTARSRFSQRSAWLALATIAPLTMLPVYHRPYDAKLLLLTIPACAILWSEGKRAAWLGMVFTALGIVITSDLPLGMLSILSKGLHIPEGTQGDVITILLLRPVPIVLLALSTFYLVQYAKSCQLIVEGGGTLPRNLNAVQVETR